MFPRFFFQVTGSKAPQLKRLGQWLLENPMFDVDPKWAELVKERGNLPHDLQKRLPGNERGGSVNKGKSPGRPPMMPSPTSQQSANPANLVATSMASGLNFPLSNLNNSLLSAGLSLSNFDPKNNPLLMPFGGLTNLGALSGLGNLGNLGNMALTNSLFANLAGLGLPTLAGMEAALNAQAATSSAAAAAAAADASNPVVSSASSGSGNNKSGGASTSSSSMSNSGGNSKSRSSKLDQPTTSKSSASSSSTSAAASAATSLPFPFFFSNPSLIYPPLTTLSGLNPFSMQSGGVSTAYESLAQGLLNPPIPSASSTARKPASSSGSSSRQRESMPESSTSSSSSTKRKESEKKSARYPVDPAVTLQQYTDLAALHSSEDRRRLEQQQQHEKRESTTEQPDVIAADLSEKKVERKSKEQEMREALEHLSRTNAELVTRNVEDTPRPEKRSRSSTDSNQNSDQQQRSTPSTPLEVTLEPVTKKMRTEVDTNSKSSSNNDVVTMEIEPVPRPLLTTPTKTTTQVSPQEEVDVSPAETSPPKKEVSETTMPATNNATSPSTQQSSGASTKTDSGKTVSETTEEDGKGGPKTKKARSGKRLSLEPPPERKNLRSSAGRQARAAAERQARMEGEMHSEQQQDNPASTE